jgi:hypothetical protein
MPRPIMFTKRVLYDGSGVTRQSANAGLRELAFAAEICYICRMSTTKRQTISSFAAPTPQDEAAFQQLSAEEKRQVLAAEIERGLEGTPRKVSADEIMAAVRARLAHA